MWSARFEEKNSAENTGGRTFLWFCYERAKKEAEFFKRCISSSFSCGEKIADLIFAGRHT
jgi:hypothetical protein